ncbi:MAG: hypothetical protein IJC39_05100, partial [Firmicutes bacterium]|nr:hypothetical protein [Bacillota bacterium]
VLYQNTNGNMYNIPVYYGADAESSTTGFLRVGYIYDTPIDIETELAVGEAVANAETPEELAAAQKASDELYAGRYEIYGLWPYNYEVGDISVKNIYPLEDYYGLNLWPRLGNERGEMIVIDENLAINEIELPKGEYIYRFVVEDILGNEYRSADFDLAWDGENALFTAKS